MIIEVNGVSKYYSTGQRSARTVKAWISNLVRRGARVEPFWALRDVSFTVEKGEIFGILGQNGSGKSTLLAVLGGIVKPHSGEVLVRGTVGCLLTVAIGFSAELTGRDNALLNAQLLGLSHKKAKEHLPDIFAFAGISDEYLATPIKRYSAGMVARLAFSTAVECIEVQETSVMLLDEILSVGDIGFQTKCNERMMRLVKSGTTVVVVSQSPDLIANLCDRGMWMDKGRIQSIGAAKDVAEEYRRHMQCLPVQSVEVPI